MAHHEIERIQRDELALSVAHALMIANDAATAQGVALERSLVTITEEAGSPRGIWRIHYGPRDIVNRRGGDFTVVVEEKTGKVQRVIRGQ